MAEKKRYHQSERDRMHERRGMHHYEEREERDRMHERRGMEHAMHRNEEGSYSGEQMRRRQEMEDGGMIREDHHAVANLPQNVIYRPYEKIRSYLPEDLDDTIRGIDRQVDELDGGKVRSNMNPKKV